MKSSIAGRKPGNDMKKGEGASGINPRAKSTSQRGDGEDFAFNGQMGDGVNRMKNKYAHNTWSGHSNDGRDVNFGLMQSQRTGNASSSPKKVGPPATRDAHQMTIATASGGMPIGSGFHCPPVGNPDKINRGR